MTMLIQLKDHHTQSTLAIANGAVDTGFDVLADGTSLGSVVRKPLMPQIFNNTGVLPTGVNIEMREQQINVLISHTTVEGLQALYDSLLVMCDKISSKGGGELAYRSDAGSTVSFFRVAFAMVLPTSQMMEYESFFRMRVTIALTVDPMGLSNPYDMYDGFSTDTLGTGGVYNPGGADWTKLTGNGSSSVSGGVLTSATTTGATYYEHTGLLLRRADVQVTAKVRWNTTLVNAREAIVVLKSIDATNRLAVSAYSNGAGAGTLQIFTTIAGSSVATSTAITTLAVDTWYWIRGRIQGNVVTVEWFTSEPTPMMTPTHTTTYTLPTTGASALLGASVSAKQGVGHSTATSTGTVSFDDFNVEACTYRNVTFPASLRLEGSWGGTTDALAGIYYTGSGGTAPIAMLYAWWPRVAAHNMVWNGGGEAVGSVATVAHGWVATAVSGVIGAANTVTRGVAAGHPRTGAAYVIADCPATTDTGVTFRIYRRNGFRKGVTYTAQCYVKATAATTNVRIKLGISGDLGTGTASALTTSWAPRTVTWTPTADSDLAHVSIGISAATATVFQIDDVVVFEGTTAPTCELGGFGPGIIPGGAYNQALATVSGTVWTQTADADYLVGVGPQASGALSTGGWLRFPILPHLFTPDDFTGDEVDLAVFARIELASTQTSLNCAISMVSNRGQSFGSRRYGSYKSSGKTLKLPSSGTVFRPFYLGTITMKVDRNRPRQELLDLTFTNAGGATGVVGLDYLIVVPIRRVARSRSGVQASIIPSFIVSTSETTKSIGIGPNGRVLSSLVGGIVDYNNGVTSTGVAVAPDDGLLGSPISLPKDGAELLVWPSDIHVDCTDSVSTNMAENFSGTVQVAIQPRHELLRQA